MEDIFEELKARKQALEKYFEEKGHAPKADKFANVDVAQKVRETIENLPSYKNLTLEQAVYAIDWMSGDYKDLRYEIDLGYSELLDINPITRRPEPRKGINYLKSLIKEARKDLQCSRLVCSRCPDLPPKVNELIKRLDDEEIIIQVYEKAIDGASALLKNYPITFEKLFLNYTLLLSAIYKRDYKTAAILKEQILRIEPNFHHWKSLEDRV